MSRVTGRSSQPRKRRQGTKGLVAYEFFDKENALLRRPVGELEPVHLWNWHEKAWGEYMGDPDSLYWAIPLGRRDAEALIREHNGRPSQLDDPVDPNA